jgi:transposase
MKRMILSTALALSLTGAAAFAQQTQPATPQTDTQNNTQADPGAAPMHHHRGHHRADPQHQAEFLSKKLNLSPDQTAKLQPILADRQQKFDALRQNSSLTPDQRHEQMKAIHQSTQQQLASVLSPDQLEQLKSMRHGRRGGFGPHGHDAPEAQPQPSASPTGL